LLVKYPTSVSDSLIISGNTIVTLSVNELKQVPAGNFSSCHYLIKIPGTNGIQLHNYYSPGIGRIYYDIAGYINNRWVLQGRVELISYLLK
jgi:hypothetical protein